MFRVWYSTESFADYIIDKTKLKNQNPDKKKMYESDANNPTRFHTMPDHIRKILYLDAPDLIVEKDNEPIFSVELTTEAGTGHNAFQRFARIAASAENSVPSFYIYPEGAIINRNTSSRWDIINPAIFQALESVMSIYGIPALLYYYPTDIKKYYSNPTSSPNYANKGIKYDAQLVKYSACPDSSDSEMIEMFKVMSEIILEAKNGVQASRNKLLASLLIRQRRNFMQTEFNNKAGGKSISEMSPLSACTMLPTQFVTKYLARYENQRYSLGELLPSREYTLLYQVNARFRGDPYPGALAAIDYLACRQGKTYEDRKHNLILVFGQLEVDNTNKIIKINNENQSTINDFISAVKASEKHNLLTKTLTQIKNTDIPRYYMQVRYGSTYSKVKHIRVYSYFADAILFPDGSLWRDG